MFQISKVVFNTGGKEGNMFGLPNASCIYMNEKIWLYEMYVRNVYIYQWKDFNKKNLALNRRCPVTQLNGTFANPPLDELIEHEWNILGLLEHFLFIFVDKRCRMWI